jgi:hypothetical protein
LLVFNRCSSVFRRICGSRPAVDSNVKEQVRDTSTLLARKARKICAQRAAVVAASTAAFRFCKKAGVMGMFIGVKLVLAAGFGCGVGGG